MGIHRPSRESRRPEDWGLKQDVCGAGGGVRERESAEEGAVGGQALATSIGGQLPS